MKNRIILMLFTTLFLFSASSFAQVFLPPPPPVPNMSNVIWNNYIMNQMGIQAVGQQILGNEMLKNQKKNSKPVASPNNSQVFSAKLAFKASGYSLLAEKLLAQNNSNVKKQDLDNFFNGLWKIYTASFREENQRLGIPLEDIATTFTFYILNNYMISNDLTSLKAENTLAVYKQVAPIFLNNPKILNLPQKDKELLAEVFVSIGGIPSVILQTSSDKVKAKETAQKNLERIFGQKAAQLKITDNGIEF
jgi:hypothetical protein